MQFKFISFSTMCGYFLCVSFYIYIYIYIYIYKDSVDKKSTAFGDCQFLTYAIIRPNDFHIEGICLYIVVYSMMGRVIKFVQQSRKDAQVYRVSLYYINLWIYLLCCVWFWVLLFINMIIAIYLCHLFTSLKLSLSKDTY